MSAHLGLRHSGCIVTMAMRQTLAVTRPKPKIVTDPVASANAAGLKYVSDTKPGLHRERNGDGFRYYDEKNRLIRDDKVLRRIQSLAIPPAWQDVWICPLAEGHLQATGRDDKRAQAVSLPSPLASGA